MVFKKIFGGGNKQEEQREYNVDELIILERYDDAVLKLRAKMKVKDELHDHLKLAEVFTQLRELEKAVDEYVYVADEFARDGFFDKTTALLARAQKLAPLDENIPQRIDRIEQLRRLEQSRAMAMEGLNRRQQDQVGPRVSVVEFGSLWTTLSRTQVVRQLSGEQLRLLFGAVEIAYVEINDVPVRRGQILESLLILARGQLDARASDGFVLRSFGPGDIINEAGLFERKAAVADYVVTERGAVLRLDRNGLEQSLKGNPDPRRLLGVLRDQVNDRDVASILHKLGKT